MPVIWNCGGFQTLQVHLFPQTLGYHNPLIRPARMLPFVQEEAGSLDTRKDGSCVAAGSPSATALLRSWGPQGRRPCRNEAWKFEGPLWRQDNK